MGYDYDLITIGLGPAGMAVSIMGSAMGLKVKAIEKDKIGGECMNVGCIPSKSLLSIAKRRHIFDSLKGEAALEAPAKFRNPFADIQNYIRYIGDKKTRKMFDKVDLSLGQPAHFVDPHTVELADGQRATAKRIFLATGTQPMLPPIPGLESVPILTNQNVFTLEAVPKRLIVLGGGAIACEMAQGFQRLGSEVVQIQRSPHILRAAGPEAGDTLAGVFREEGIDLRTGRLVERVEPLEGVAGVRVLTDQGESIESDRVLVALGRRIDLSPLKPEKAGLVLNDDGSLKVDKYLRTNRKHIFAVGDVNNTALFSHAAMHQGMVALMNSMILWPFKMNFRGFVVPWTVFTDPQVSVAGRTEAELREAGVRFETVEVRYEDYGAAIAEDVEVGSIRAHVSPWGKILGVIIVGEGSGEMINEWALAIQKGMRMTDIMMLQHSFPTMGFLTKRVSETWMMGNMGSPFLQRMCKLFFRL